MTVPEGMDNNRVDIYTQYGLAGTVFVGLKTFMTALAEKSTYLILLVTAFTWGGLSQHHLISDRGTPGSTVA